MHLYCIVNPPSPSVAMNSESSQPEWISYLYLALIRRRTQVWPMVEADESNTTTYCQLSLQSIQIRTIWLWNCPLVALIYRRAQVWQMTMGVTETDAGNIPAYLLVSFATKEQRTFSGFREIMSLLSTWRWNRYDSLPAYLKKHHRRLLITDVKKWVQSHASRLDVIGRDVTRSIRCKHFFFFTDDFSLTYQWKKRDGDSWCVMK